MACSQLLQELALLRESVRERDDVISQLRKDHTGSVTDHTDKVSGPQIFQVEKFCIIFSGHGKT